MLDSRWPRGPLIILVLLVPALIILNPYLKAVLHSVRPTGADAQSTVPFSPQAQGSYVLDRLDSLANAYWARVSGRDNNQPAHLNGHDEFAAAWLKEMLHSLHGLNPGVFNQEFAVPGFRGRLASLPGRNVIVTVRGASHPETAIVIASHYDGEPFSKGSAFDDTSGSAIILGLARALGQQWRSKGLPSESVEFVLFDAEEQGLIGSGDYLYELRHGALLPHVQMMIDEEQSGVGYPVRPFGLSSPGPMPSYATTTVQNSEVKALFKPLTEPNAKALKLMRSRLVVDANASFATLHRTYPTLPFRGGVPVPAFTPSQINHLVIGPTPICCSDNAPFEALGLPTVTLSGDFRFYNGIRPDWSYPYDQPEDTPAALACDTGGSVNPSKALQAALDLPVVLSDELINQYAPTTTTKPTSFAVLSTRLAAENQTEFSAAGPGPISWSFGDGTTARGARVSHRYAMAGTYSIRLRSRAASTSIAVVVKSRLGQPHLWKTPLNPPRVIPWHPKELAGIRGCP